MVGKLIKHELKALFRVILFVGIGVVIVALIGRIIYAADPDSIAGLSFGFLAIYAAIVAALMAFSTSIVNFSRSFFTGEGYLTFSIPASPTQLIVSKLIAAIIANLYGVAVMTVSIAIFFSGFDQEALRRFGDVIGELWRNFLDYFGGDPMLLVEEIIQFIVSLPLLLLFFFTAISLGQLFTNGRKAITFIIAIGGLIFASLFMTYLYHPLQETMLEISLHLVNWVDIALGLALDLGMFFLIRYILMHRVNLIV